jgi:hypothetical protein
VTFSRTGFSLSGLRWEFSHKSDRLKSVLLDHHSNHSVKLVYMEVRKAGVKSWSDQ